MNILQKFLSLFSGMKFLITTDTALKISNDKLTGFVFTACDVYGKYFAKAKFRLYEKDRNIITEIFEHPILELFEKPNDFQTFWELKYRWAFDLAIYGNSYLYKARDKLGITRELIPLNPALITISGSNKKSIENYEFHGAGDIIKIKPEDIIHIRHPSGENPVVGRPILANILDQVEIDKIQTAYQKKFYQEGGFLGLTFVTKRSLSKESFNRTKKELEQRYGRENAFKVALLDEVEPVKNPYSMKDMDIFNLRSSLRDEILSVFQIPKILVGLGESINRNTADASIYQFTSGVIDPLLYLIDEILTKNLAKEFDNRYYIEHDILAPRDIEANLKYINQGINEGWLTLNEVRVEEGRNPYDLPEANQPIIAVNRMPLSMLGKNRNQKPDEKKYKAGMVVQSILFDKEKFTIEEAREWLKKHKYKDNGYDETDKYYRFRQRDPEDFIKDSFRTIQISDGIKFVIGKLKEDKKSILRLINIANN